MAFKDMIIEFDKKFSNNTNIEYVKNKSKIYNSVIPEDMLLDDKNFIEEESKIVIDQKYLEYFRVASCSSCWSYTNDKNQFIYGGFLFNGYLEALIQDSDFWDISNSINRYEPDEKELEFLKKLNWFEKQAWGDDGKFGCFLREPGDFPPKIYFYDNGAYFPMALTFEQYIEAMVASCAVRGWQYFYINIPDNFPDFKRANKNTVLEDLQLAVELLPKLFPDEDFSYHIKKMDYIKDRLK